MDRVWLKTPIKKLQVNNTFNFYTVAHNNVGNLKRAKVFDSKDKKMIFNFVRLQKTVTEMWTGCFRMVKSSHICHS